MSTANCNIPKMLQLFRKKKDFSNLFKMLSFFYGKLVHN